MSINYPAKIKYNKICIHLFAALLYLYACALGAETVKPVPIIVDQSTTVSSSIEESSLLVYEDVLGELTIKEILEKKNSFLPHERFINLNYKSSYWTYFRIKSELKETKIFAINASSLWKKVDTYVRDVNGNVSKLPTSGFFTEEFRDLFDADLSAVKNIDSQYPTVNVNPGETIEIFSQLTFRKAYVPNGFSFILKDHILALEHRSFGLHLEGIISGVLIALLILAFFSYYNFKEETNLYYAIWLLASVLSVLNMPVHGSQNLARFYWDFGSNTYFGLNSSFFYSLVFNYGQLILYLIFVRSFINSKSDYPTFHRISNIVVILLIVNGLVTQLWTPLSSRYLFFLSSLLTYGCFIFILTITYKKAKAGEVLFKYFLCAFIFYLSVRTIFLTVLLGFDSPIKYFPDNRYTILLNDSRIFQGLAVAFEAVLMSLILVVRTKLIQEKLNKNISEQAVMAARQQKVLEETVKDKTSELVEKSNSLERISNKLAKYIPPQIHNALFSGQHNTEITTRRKKLTVFFSDIKEFTATSENLQPEDLTKYLNEYFSEMTDIAIRRGGTIDKYIGDAMMVFFGDPETKGEKEDAKACVDMALEMQERLTQLQQKWKESGFSDPFQVRMGINTGYCNVGNFGSDQRLTYTIIGGEVNIAARLEKAADPGGILISYETYAYVQENILAKDFDSIKMKGITRDIKVFSVIERKSKVGNEKKEIKKKPSKREQSQIEKLEKDMLVMKSNIEDINKKMDAVLKKL